MADVLRARAAVVHKQLAVHAELLGGRCFVLSACHRSTHFTIHLPLTKQVGDFGLARAAKGAVSVDTFGTVSHMSPGGCDLLFNPCCTELAQLAWWAGLN